MLQLADRAIAIARTLLQLAEKTRYSELRLQIVDLMSTVADLKTELVDLQTELTQARRQARKTQARLKLRAQVEFRDGHYHLRKPVRGLSEGPFCALCYEEKGLLITVSRRQQRRLSTGATTAAGYRCPRCARRG